VKYQKILALQNYWLMASRIAGKGGKMSEEERMRLDNEYADHL
jgi:hypothetical protein